MNEQQFQKIQAKYGDEYLLRQLAEECIELAHASLKLIRAMRGETPLPIEKSRASFLEEVADVRVMYLVLSWMLGHDEILSIQEQSKEKECRMIERLLGEGAKEDEGHTDLQAGRTRIDVV